MWQILIFLTFNFITAFGGDLKTLEKYLNDTRTLKVSFTQKVRYDWYPKEDESRGIFYAKKGGLFRLDYFSPDRITIISDGKKVYVINYEDRTVYVEPVSENTSPVIGSLFLMSKPLSEVFELVSKMRRGNYEVFVLKPLKKDENVTQVMVYVDDSGTIRKIVSYDEQNTRTEIDFIQVKRNFTPSEELFRVNIPDGFRVKNDG